MRTILLLSALATFAGLTVACSGSDTSKLANEPTIVADSDATEDEDEDTTQRPAQRQTETQQPKTQAQTQTPAKTEPNTCDPNAAETKEDCAKCCAQQAPKKAVDSCACGAAGKCTTVCQENVCKGNLPDIQCGLCLFQNGCDVGDLGDLGTEASQCLQQCANKK